MRKLNFTEEQIKEMSRLYIDENASLESIGKKFNCAKTVIKRRMIELDVYKTKRDFLTKTQKDQILNLWNDEKLNLAQIKKELNISETPIRNFLKKENLYENRAIKIKFSRKEEQNICDEFKDGASIKQLARNLKISTGSVRRILEKNNKFVAFVDRPRPKPQTSHESWLKYKDKWIENYRKENPPLKKKCLFCSKNFTAGAGGDRETRRAKFCSKECSIKYQNTLNKEKRYQISKRWKASLEGQKWQYEYEKEKYINDPQFRLKKLLMGRIGEIIRNAGSAKYERTSKLLGCTNKQVASHLAKQFTKDMTLENLGEWHIDHVRPCNSFDLTDKRQQFVCFNWRNLQPLWANENIAKQDKYTKEDEKLWIKRMRDLGFEGQLFTLF